MKNRRTVRRECIVIAWAVLSLVSHSQPTGGVAARDDASPRGFAENAGQVRDQFGAQRPDVRFLARFPRFAVHLTSTGFSYEFTALERDIRPGTDRMTLDDDDPTTVRRHRVDIRFPGATTAPRITSDGLQMYTSNHYRRGPGTEGCTAVRYWSTVTYHDVFPGIDLIFQSTVSRSDCFKYDIVLHPGADPRQFRMAVHGATAALEPSTGSLLIGTSLGEVRESIPEAHAISSDGKRSDRPARFVVVDGEVRLDVDRAVSGETIVVDPFVKWGTYFGGEADEFGHNLTVDAAGNLYLTGRTISSHDIATVGAYQTSWAGDWDAFLARFNDEGRLLWATYYGGADYDNFIAVQIVGQDVVVAGATSSIAGIATNGAYQTGYGGGNRDVLLARFHANGTRIWATYFGGSGEDIGYALETTAGGGFHVAGSTGSRDGIATVGAWQETYGGGVHDVFLAEFDANGWRIWGTYHGGPKTDEGASMKRLPDGRLVIAGESGSMVNIATPGAHQSVYGGGDSDGLLSLFSSDGRLVWSTYLGGRRTDRLYMVALDNHANLLVAGITDSDSCIATAGAHQMTCGGDFDAMAAKFDSAGARIWGTYYGGTKQDVGYGVTSNAGDEVIIAGYANSTSGIATVDGILPTHQGQADIFAAKLSPAGTRVWGTYLGGPAEDICKSIMTVRGEMYYLIGNSMSGTGIATAGTHQPDRGGYRDAFVIAIDDGVPTELRLTPGGDRAICTGGAVELSCGVVGGGPPLTYQWTPEAGLSSPRSRTTMASPSVSTTYTLIVSDQSLHRDSVHIRVLVSSPVVDAGPDRTIEAGSSTQLGSEATGGLPPYTHVWIPSTGLSDPLAARPMAAPITTTLYRVHVVDSAGCTATDEVLVTVAWPPQRFMVDLGPDTVVCPASTTRLIAFVSGGTPPHRYSWSPDSGLSSTTIANPMATIVRPITYVCTVTDAFDHVTQDTIHLGISTASMADIDITHLFTTWPWHDLGFTVRCCGEIAGQRYGVENFSIHEDGMPVDTFTLVPPDSGAAIVTTALVFHCPTSLSGAPLGATVHAAISLTNTFDGVRDEACVIRLEDVIRVSQEMTVNTGLLASAIRGLSPGGRATIWDACQRGMTEVVRSARNSNRSVILLTDGRDSGSVASLGSLAGYALQHDIRIHTIGLGIDASTQSLEWLSQQTGGEHHHALSPIQLPEVYFRILKSMRAVGQMYRARFRARCAGDSVRQVTLTSVDICTGSDAETRTTVVDLPRPVILPSDAALCPGDSVVLDAGPGFVSYTWSHGSTGRFAIARQVGSYSVRVVDSLGCAWDSAPAVVVARDAPARPVITRQGDTLTASDAAWYQWYRNGVPIPGATGRQWVITESGTYSVVVRDAPDGCTAGSDSMNVVVGVILPTAIRACSVFPDPSLGCASLHLSLFEGVDGHIAVTDVLGRLVHEQRFRSTVTEFTTRIDITGQPAGVYLIHITLDRERVTTFMHICR